MTLREVIQESVGDDVATPEYLTGLGYDDDALNVEATLIYKSAEPWMEIWSLGYGFHVSTETSEAYSDDLVRDYGYGSTVHFWWDDQDPKNEGWYAEERDSEGQYLDDSQKVWFKPQLEDYTEEQADEVREALQTAFPLHKIVRD